SSMLSPWAKEIKFGSAEINTLNYNVRILGRKGVLILNAIASVNSLAVVKADIPKVLNSVHFSDGNKYNDFNPEIDEVAAWTIGGLVAGKILAKVGFFALILKFWKFIAIGAVAAFSFVRKKFFGKKDSDDSTGHEDDIAQNSNIEIEDTSNTAADETIGSGEAVEKKEP
ncbi:MAG: DUF2167 domain-containing protein, partial [Sphingobacteriales bacterium]